MFSFLLLLISLPFIANIGFLNSARMNFNFLTFSPMDLVVLYWISGDIYAEFLTVISLFWKKRKNVKLPRKKSNHPVKESKRVHLTGAIDSLFFVSYWEQRRRN